MLYTLSIAQCSAVIAVIARTLPNVCKSTNILVQEQEGSSGHYNCTVKIKQIYLYQMRKTSVIFYHSTNKKTVSAEPMSTMEIIHFKT